MRFSRLEVADCLEVRQLAGINQKLTKASSKSLHRWIELMNEDPTEYALRPIEIMKWPTSILDYLARATGPTISPLDETVLPPGDYGLFGVF